jgi:hypothetical protein
MRFARPCLSVRNYGVANLRAQVLVVRKRCVRINTQMRAVKVQLLIFLRDMGDVFRYLIRSLRSLKSFSLASTAGLSGLGLRAGPGPRSWPKRSPSPTKLTSDVASARPVVFLDKSALATAQPSALQALRSQLAAGARSQCSSPWHSTLSNGIAPSSPSPARAQPEPSPSSTRAQLGPARLSSSAQLGSARSRASPQPAQRDSGRVRRRLWATLVWDLKAAAGLVDGVRQNLFCTSRRGPLHNPHHPTRSHVVYERCARVTVPAPASRRAPGPCGVPPCSGRRLHSCAATKRS